MDQYNALFEQASSQGQTLIAASGDSGSTACMPFTSAQGITLAEQQALAVSFPASSPMLQRLVAHKWRQGHLPHGDNSYWASTPIGGTDITGSLQSYVPEVVWNEGSVSNGIIAGGGGSSSHFPKAGMAESYPGMPSGADRLLPDISLQSSVASPGFLKCSSDPTLINRQGQTSSCVYGMKGNNNQYTIAGRYKFRSPNLRGSHDPAERS